MDVNGTEGLRDQLMSNNSEFRDLAREHGRYEARLTELSALAYPNDEEQLEEVTLKKKKLVVKDQMQAIMQQHQAEISSGH